VQQACAQCAENNSGNDDPAFFALGGGIGGSSGSSNNVLKVILNFTRGAADAMDFGIGDGVLGYSKLQGVDTNSVEYRAAPWVVLIISWARAAYTATTLSIPAYLKINPSTATLRQALMVAKARNEVKAFFRLGLFRNARMDNLFKIAHKYGKDPQRIIYAAQRTSLSPITFFTDVMGISARQAISRQQKDNN
jgi:hypothetical protein